MNLPFAMDPLTDYVLDIEMLNSSDEVVHPSEIENEVGQRPLYRKNFSTYYDYYSTLRKEFKKTKIALHFRIGTSGKMDMNNICCWLK